MSLTGDGIDLQRADRSVHLRIVEGGYWDPPEARGTDIVIPGARGLRRRNRVASRQVIVLAGWVRGIGATMADQRAAFVALKEALEPLWDPERDPWALVDTRPGGTTKTAQVRFVSAQWEPDVLSFFQRATSIELEAVTYPFWT